MSENSIGFIGGGHMAASLIGGLLQTGFDAKNILVQDIVKTPVAAKYDIQLTQQRAAILACHTVVLAVKPQVLPDLARQIANQITANPPLFISIAAGVRASDLQRWLGKNVPIIRVMPNTPALVQSGASGLYAAPSASADHKQLAESLVNAVGISVWVDSEAKMDVLTALSGSGPAYFFLVMEVMQQAAIELGLSQEQAKKLTLQTAYGAANMAINSTEDSATLRQQVTSKGGTTEQAINVLLEQGLADTFKQALSAASQRSAKLAKTLAAK